MSASLAHGSFGLVQPFQFQYEATYEADVLDGVAVELSRGFKWRDGAQVVRAQRHM